ncbi:hypothetical protein WNY59_05280 [Ahrensia kielensis]|uniref:Uncharacterized protein n=1 Tax=Ahrensia kielensis TaxID=76980 RepID=A0ABU9T4E6_9HYPH
MKTLALTLAASVLASSAAFAAENLDVEATSSINPSYVSSTTVYEAGNEYEIRYSLNNDGTRNVIQKTFVSSDG